VMAQDAQDDGGGYGRWQRRWAVAQDDVAAAARHGGAGECRVVVDEGGATRTARLWQEVRRRLRMEDEQERKN
jgi:hypothetical protein